VKKYKNLTQNKNPVYYLRGTYGAPHTRIYFVTTSKMNNFWNANQNEEILTEAEQKEIQEREKGEFEDFDRVKEEILN